MAVDLNAIMRSVEVHAPRRSAEAERILDAMRADAIPAGASGLWYVAKATVGALPFGDRMDAPGSYTFLYRYTDSTMLRGGESVMSDNRLELAKHLDFVMRARGRVLVTGLGLGCVLRGLMARAQVESIDLVERDRDVIALVWPHIPKDPRVTLHCAEAVDWVKRHRDRRWDAAWHDLWTDTDSGEPSLPIVHQRLMLALRRRVGWQGAWHFPRHLQRVLRERFATCGWWAPR